jgi:hypothetical protein
MRLFKYLYRIALVAWTLGTIFGFGPDDWRSSVDLLTRIDLFIINNAQYPGLLAVAIGIILGTWVVPDCWRLVFRYLDDRWPNWQGRDAFQYLVLDSKWAANKGPGAKGFELAHEAEEIVRDAARTGRIKVWGRDKQRLRSVGNNALYELPQDFWKDGRIDPLTFIYESLGNVSAARPFGAPTVLVEDLQFNRRSFLNEWPRRSWPFRMIDRRRGERRRIFKESVHEELHPNAPGEARLRADNPGGEPPPGGD